MIKWNLQIKKFIDEIKPNKTCTNTALVLQYYQLHGVDYKTSTKEWLIGLSKKDYPSFTRCYQLIKQYRN